MEKIASNPVTSVAVMVFSALKKQAPKSFVIVSLQSGKEKQHKHKLFGPGFPRTFLTLTPGRPWVKKFLPITGAAERRTFWCGRPRFLARTSMTRRVFEKLCTKKVCVDFLAPREGLRKPPRGPLGGPLKSGFLLGDSWSCCPSLCCSLIQKTVPGRVRVKFAQNGATKKPRKTHEKVTKKARTLFF